MSYNKRILKDRMHRVARGYRETFDAIVWEVLPSQRICRVRIQGSNEDLYPSFPQNWESTPQFLKPGNAVTVQRRGGNRNIMEVVGHGRNLPTFPKSTDVMPVVPMEDVVISGGALRPVGGALQVWVETGIIRINSAEYILDDIEMDESTVFDMDSEIEMGTCAAVLGFTVPASGYYRYDLVVVGSDGVVDVVSGTPATSYPVMPATPAGHAVLGFVLLNGGMTEITTSDINKLWVPATPTSMLISCPVEDGMAWLANPATITIEIKDQFGNSISSNFAVKVTVEEGNGYLYQDESNPATTLTEITKNFSGASTTVKYYRLNDIVGETDRSPKIRLELVGFNFIYNYQLIILLDSLGEIMA